MKEHSLFPRTPVYTEGTLIRIMFNKFEEPDFIPGIGKLVKTRLPQFCSTFPIFSPSFTLILFSLPLFVIALDIALLLYEYETILIKNFATVLS